ncbi:MAG: SO_0444 family Cu/Zn efflux transporter [Acidobacteria bacterium]|nr:SO_0444 family Cu/Zn efflux transporter [Acidobacteriota bacterium]
MWDLLYRVIVETVSVFNELSFYLLLGLFFAGIIKQFIPTEFLINHLGKSNLISVFKAALIGVPLPLCSCSVLPTAVAIKKKGASSGATTAFLISTPETGIDSISMTYALLDPIFTIFRPLAAFFTAIVCGSSVNYLENREQAKNKKLKKAETKKDTNDSGYSEIAKNAISRDSFLEIFKYGYFRLLGEIAGWLLLGLFFAGAIAAIIPESFFTKYLSDPLLSMLVMIVIGVPIYICATGSTPIAAALIAKGLNPGAALVFLLVGPATNISSFFVLKKYIKKKYLAVYLISLIIVSLFLGLIINMFYGPGESPVSTASGEMGRGLPSWLQVFSSIILAMLLLRALYVNRTLPALLEKLSTLIKKIGFKPKTIYRVLIIILVLSYLLSGLFQVNVGETGFVVVFGKVTRVIDEPGLYFSLPYPITKIIKQSHSEVYEIEIGFRTEQTAGESLLQDTDDVFSLDNQNLTNDIPEIGMNIPEEGFIFTGDENIVDLDLTCHYRVSDPYKYRYQWKNNDDIIRAVMLTSLRRILNKTDIMSILVDRREDLTKEVKLEAEKLLGKLDTGIDLLYVNFTNIHAPSNVHYYFRDVSSSMEEKQKMINVAEKYALDTTIRSRGEAIKIQNEAESYKTTELSQAVSKAESLTARYKAFLIAPEITRFRVYIDTIEKVLGNSKSIFVLKFRNKSAVDFWLDTNEKKTFLPYKSDKEN